MRKPFEHGSCVEVPDVGAAHDVKTEGTEYAKIDGGIHLFHEPGCFTFSADSTVYGERTDQALHQKLARKRENDRVEATECNILRTFTIHNRTARSFRGLGVREENGGVHRVRRGRVDRICEKENRHYY